MEPRARAPRPRLAWLPAAGGALLLVLVGFAVGLVAGAAFEEPDLVLAQIGGRTTGVPLPIEGAGEPDAALVAEPDSDAEAAAVPAVAAPPPAAGSPGPAAAPPARASAAAAAAAPAGEYAVQVGAFADAETAERLVERLRAIEVPAYVLDVGALEKARFRVRVGPLASEEEAQQLSTRLRADHQLPTWVIGGDGR